MHPLPLPSAMKILVAEDEQETLLALKIGLEGLGFEVRTVQDAVRAFTHAQKELPDAILLDISMPRGSGLEVLGLLKASQLTKHIPVIVMSGSTDPEVPKKAKELGAVEYLVKPLYLTQIRGALAKLPARPAPAAGEER
jgi:CheY-like chemotaxis protein